MAQGVGDQVVEQAGQRGGIGLDGHSGRVPPEKPYRVSGALPGAYLLVEPVVEWQPLEAICARVGSAHEPYELVDHALHIPDVLAHAFLEFRVYRMTSV